MKNLTPKIIKTGLALLTIGFLFLTVERMSMDYNENGVYFDGMNTYDRDAIVTYGFLTGMFFVSTIASILLWRKSSSN